jgi:hypothetical protein
LVILLLGFYTCGANIGSPTNLRKQSGTLGLNRKQLLHY